MRKAGRVGAANFGARGNQGARLGSLERRRKSRRLRVVSAWPVAAADAARPISTTVFAEASTTYGQIGIKVWLYKGERLVPLRGREERVPGTRATTAARAGIDDSPSRGIGGRAGLAWWGRSDERGGSDRQTEDSGFRGNWQVG